MASGVSVDNECKTEFQNLKTNRHAHYIIFKIADDYKSIQVDKQFTKDECKGKTCQEVYEEHFMKELLEVESAGSCRYGVFDVSYMVNNVKKEKIALFYWGPDSAKIKQKMVYSSSFAALKESLGPGIQINIQANDSDDLKWGCVLEACQKHARD